MTLKEPQQIAPQRYGAIRLILRLGVIFGIVLLAKLGMDALSAKVTQLESDSAKGAMIGLIILVLIGYALMLAIPFLPGVEIGIAVLLIQGASAAPYVYLATLTGLSLAFLFGQFVPLDRLSRFCADLYMFRVCALLHTIKTTPLDQRLTTLNDRLPRWLAPVLINYRYVTLGALINLPGNIALGGGGGIMMAAGLSRLFRTQHTIIAIAIFTLPVPLAVWIMGTDILR